MAGPPTNTSLGSQSQSREQSQKQQHDDDNMEVENNDSIIPDPWNRLIWAKFGNVGYWWPAFVYQNAGEMDQVLHKELHLNTANSTAKLKLGFAIMTEPLTQSYVRFLGRPLKDLEPIDDGSYHNFFQQLQHNLDFYAKKPDVFDNDQELYYDWHRAMDEAIRIVHLSPDVTHSASGPSWFERARDAWGVVPVDPDAVSVAAVSLMTEDSGYPSPARTADPEASTTPLTPPLVGSPIARHSTWEDAWHKLQFNSWSNLLADDGQQKLYQPPAMDGKTMPPMTLKEAQEYAAKHYGWVGPPAARRLKGITEPASNRLRRATRSPTEQDEEKDPRKATREAKRKAFGFLWGAHLSPAGWSLVNVKKGDKHHGVADYYYIQPNKHVQNGEEGVDYFINTDDVVDWCQRNGEYPPSSSDEDTTREPVHDDDDATTLHPASSPDSKADDETSGSGFGAPGGDEEEESKEEDLDANSASANARNNKRSATEEMQPKKKPKNETSKQTEQKKILQENEAKWATDPIPKDVYKICQVACGINYSCSKYYFPGETGSNYTVRFASLDELRLHCCSNAYRFLPGAPEETKQLFIRWVNYTHVPGSPREWRNIQQPTEKEVVKLLKQVGYKTRNGTWSPTENLQGVLNKSYDSLADLCRALQTVGDLETANRSRHFKSKFKNDESMKVWLWIAESLYLENGPSIGRENLVQPPVSSTPINTDEKKEDTLDKDVTPDSDTSDSQSTSNESIYNPADLTLEMAKLVVEELKVKKEKDNDAPWVKNPPVVRDLFKKLELLGVTSSSGKYFLRGESPKNHSISFNSSNEMVSHWGRVGSPDLSRLPPYTEREIRRLMNYANVPGFRNEWVRIRHLKPREAACLLMVLEFDLHEDGCWTVPDHVGTPQKTYESLQELCIALRPVENLEKESSKRPSRRVKSTAAIKEKHMVALRLFIAGDLEGVDCETDSHSSESTRSQKSSRVFDVEERKNPQEVGAKSDTTTSPTCDDQEMQCDSKRPETQGLTVDKPREARADASMMEVEDDSHGHVDSLDRLEERTNPVAVKPIESQRTVSGSTSPLLEPEIPEMQCDSEVQAEKSAFPPTKEHAEHKVSPEDSLENAPLQNPAHPVHKTEEQSQVVAEVATSEVSDTVCNSLKCTSPERDSEQMECYSRVPEGDESPTSPTEAHPKQHVNAPEMHTEDDSHMPSERVDLTDESSRQLAYEDARGGSTITGHDESVMAISNDQPEAHSEETGPIKEKRDSSAAQLDIVMEQNEPIEVTEKVIEETVCESPVQRDAGDTLTTPPAEAHRKQHIYVPETLTEENSNIPSERIDSTRESEPQVTAEIAPGVSTSTAYDESMMALSNDQSEQYSEETGPIREERDSTAAQSEIAMEQNDEPHEVTEKVSEATVCKSEVQHAEESSPNKDLELIGPMRLLGDLDHAVDHADAVQDVNELSQVPDQSNARVEEGSSTAVEELEGVAAGSLLADERPNAVVVRQGIMAGNSDDLQTDAQELSTEDGEILDSDVQSLDQSRSPNQAEEHESVSKILIPLPPTDPLNENLEPENEKHFDPYRHAFSQRFNNEETPMTQPATGDAPDETEQQLHEYTNGRPSVATNESDGMEDDEAMEFAVAEKTPYVPSGFFASEQFKSSADMPLFTQPADDDDYDDDECYEEPSGLRVGGGFCSSGPLSTQPYYSSDEDVIPF